MPLPSNLRAREMIRVLKPHGQLVLADQDVQQHVRLLRGAGLRDAHSRPESLLIVGADEVRLSQCCTHGGRTHR
jgi:hypothetical protein